MSAIAVGGRRYAAGLFWLARGGAGATARAARRLGRPWFVHHGERTGFAAGGAADGLSGVPALALALLAHIDGGFWMALVEGDAGSGGADGGSGGDRGRFALVKARDGAVLADGDELFESRAAALAAFERSRGLGWTLHATPGLMAGLDGSAIAALDPAALDEAAAKAGAAIALTRAAAPGKRAGRPAALALGLAALGVLTGAWFERDALMAWLAAPEPAPPPAASLPEPRIDVAVDSAALIAACRQALIDNPPFLPAWRIERIDCTARFADPELSGLRPELAGRAVLLARWRRAPGHAEALQRRLAENHLGQWHAAAVADGRAWAAVPLAPVLRAAHAAVPFLELRKSVDRAFGAHAARLGYARGAEGAWTVLIEDPGPLSRLAPIVGGIAGLEIVALSRGGDGGWRLEGRAVAPERIAASRLRALGVRAERMPDTGGEPPMDRAAGPGAVPETAGARQSEREYGTKHRDKP